MDEALTGFKYILATYLLNLDRTWKDMAKNKKSFFDGAVISSI